MRPRMATGYTIRTVEGEPQIAPHPMLHGWDAAGSLYSSVNDLARWISFQFRTKAGGAWRLAGAQRPHAQRDASRAVHGAELDGGLRDLDGERTGAARISTIITAAEFMDS